DNKYFPITTIYRYFETFDELVRYRNGDLTYCDLSRALECDADFSNYIIDETTKLPVHTNTEVTYAIKKYYQNGKFHVTQQWCNTSGSVVKEYRRSFDYFFDFVSFLKGDLSEANLLFCDGLMFLEQWNTIDFTNAKMKSSLCEKFGLKYHIQEINGDLVKSFDYVEQNENETAIILQTSRNLTEEAARKDLSTFDMSFDNKCQRVHYVSDIHLMHRIQNADCRSKEDVIYVIQKIVDTIANEAGSLLLIDGDVASDIGIFQLFVKILSKTLRRNTQVVFTLGNHELWSFPGLQIEQIVSKYRTILEEYGMYLLHNDLLYKEDCGLLADPNTGTHLIKYHDLCQMNETQIADRLRSARYVILGGLGFSGYNKEFNADNGIYRMTVDRTTEIKESKIFEDLYNRLRPILVNKNTIILTHTPKKDWCKEAGPDKNYVYVSGHTHRNFFHDDGEYRVYSDNQVGYHSENPHLKTFLIDNDYDCFSDYEDGIFEVTSEQYNDFYRGKNISMTFQRKVNVLYMLKKNGYYCFIHKSRSGSLTILNGGAMKKLEIQDIQYYYDNMDSMISTIKTPLDEFTSFQKRIAGIVKRIGGAGTIHGSIIDIDFYNHIYVNPLDLSITGYWASDIINKIVYPSIPALLEKNCPAIFGEYVKLLKGNSENPLAPKQQTNVAILPQTYLDTDIYKASREIKKMQKLHSNILSSWYEDTLHKRPQIELT
ncbi:MAG: metallophosphoesterase, partial [Lachnospiraceae bacterium]|nr:metallophosphoesterase [Lachnospiraceae bacterium]